MSAFEEKREAKYRDVRQIVKDSKDKRQAGRAHLYALEIPFSVIIGAVLGNLADQHFGIAPWGIGLGLAAGVGAAVRAVHRLIVWYRANDEDVDAEAAAAAEEDGAPRG